MTFLLVTVKRESFDLFASALEAENDVQVSWAASGEDALVFARQNPVEIVIADEDLGDMKGLHLAENILSVNPAIYSSVVSRLKSEEFHEASEGLGVLLQLPPSPGKKEAKQLLDHLRKVDARMVGPGSP